mmetsp:Transcript_10954/g.33597  ORF Transcript_10954/g.33597 Transcript_10954/m.33597 type:complete len:393 (-) Transcript_10954:1881-3059(-)
MPPKRSLSISFRTDSGTTPSFLLFFCRFLLADSAFAVLVGRALCPLQGLSSSSEVLCGESCVSCMFAVCLEGVSFASWAAFSCTSLSSRLHSSSGLSTALSDASSSTSFELPPLSLFLTRCSSKSGEGGTKSDSLSSCMRISRSRACCLSPACFLLVARVRRISVSSSACQTCASAIVAACCFPACDFSSAGLAFKLFAVCREGVRFFSRTFLFRTAGTAPSSSPCSSSIGRFSVSCAINSSTTSAAPRPSLSVPFSNRSAFVLDRCMGFACFFLAEVFCTCLVFARRDVRVSEASFSAVMTPTTAGIAQSSLRPYTTVSFLQYLRGLKRTRSLLRVVPHPSSSHSSSLGRCLSSRCPAGFRCCFVFTSGVLALLCSLFGASCSFSGVIMGS